ncbi:MAG: hypothetical protein CFE43_11990 [Burkholderiales bacterium PBB3]|nr:MAG: hypothetical protein CFE43_11990 [Burkholderiales bacterium PBB3]
MSAVAWVTGVRGGELIFGNDKAPEDPTESSVFSMPYAGAVFDPEGEKTFYAYPPFSQVSKFESMAVSPDGQHVIAMNAFDRFSAKNSSLDAFNVLLAWNAHTPEQAQVISRSEREGVNSSLALRERLAKALLSHFGARTAYFKVEGVALLPAGRILFGVREMGRTHTDFDYRVTLIAGSYRMVNGAFSLDINTDFKVVRDFTELSNQVGRKVGLSSIEYDAAGQRLLLLTSYEGAGEVGAYVWVLPDSADGSIGNTPHLVRDAAGAPFLLTHKAEGMAVVGPGRIFVIHDDDRVATRIHNSGPGKHTDHVRQLNAAAFDIVQLGSGTAALNACPAAQQ